MEEGMAEVPVAEMGVASVVVMVVVLVAVKEEGEEEGSEEVGGLVAEEGLAGEELTHKPPT